MATTTVSYDGDGSQVDFTINYAYTAQSFVEVYVDAALQVAGTDYDFLSATVIRFQAGSVPPAGTLNVELRRVTGTTPLVDWEDGASILEADQDLADLQVLHLVEELENNEVSGMGKAGANWDAEGLRITDVAAPVAASDAATKASVKSQVDEAETSAAAALVSETNAGIFASASESSSDVSDASAGAAQASANSISTVFPISSLTVGRTLVVTGGTNYAEKRTRTLEHIADATISGEASIAFALDSVYSRYFLEMLQYRPGTDNTDLRMTISDDSETSYETEGYEVQVLGQKGSLTNRVASNQSSFLMNRSGLGNLGTDRENLTFSFDILPGNGTEPFNFYGHGIGRDTGNTPEQVWMAGQMESTVTAARITHIKFFSTTGNLGSGKLILWGIR